MPAGCSKFCACTRPVTHGFDHPLSGCLHCTCDPTVKRDDAWLSNNLICENNPTMPKGDKRGGSLKRVVGPPLVALAVSLPMTGLHGTAQGRGRLDPILRCRVLILKVKPPTGLIGVRKKEVQGSWTPPRNVTTFSLKTPVSQLS